MSVKKRYHIQHVSCLVVCISRCGTIQPKKRTAGYESQLSWGVPVQGTCNREWPDTAFF